MLAVKVKAQKKVATLARAQPPPLRRDALWPRFSPLAGGHAKLRIVHGKGTGALRREVRDVLDHHPMVRTYQNASPNDGGEGATVAALGSRYWRLDL